MSWKPRRRHVRVLYPFSGRIGLFETPVRLYDLSEGGCFILSLTDRDVGHRFVLDLDLPDTESVKLNAEVLYRRPPFGFAARFIDPSQNVLGRLSRVLANMREGEGTVDETLLAPGADSAPSRNCPRCPRSLRYITSAAGSHVYECPEHGGWRAPESGMLYPYPITDWAVDELT